jgi:hypothetical protein
LQYRKCGKEQQAPVRLPFCNFVNRVNPVEVIGLAKELTGLTELRDRTAQKAAPAD